MKQREESLKVLLDFPALFDGKLHHFKPHEISLDLKEDAMPHASRPHPVPWSHSQVCKKKLDELISQDVLEPAECSEWLAGSFIVPKSDTQARWVTDFHHLNRCLCRRVCPIPRIQVVLSCHQGYRWDVSLDLMAMFCTFVVKEEDRHLLTTAMPFGLFRCKRLPQGSCVSPDIAQEAMENSLRSIEDNKIYFDDLSVFGQDWYEMSRVLRQILQCLLDAGFSVNPRECKWCAQEVPLLRHSLTPEGIKPSLPKVKAILVVHQPATLKQLKSFLGLVTHCRDADLLQSLQSNPNVFEQTLGGCPIICLKGTPNWKHHEALAHSEAPNRLHHNLARVFCHPRLK